MKIKSGIKRKRNDETIRQRSRPKGARRPATGRSVLGGKHSGESLIDGSNGFVGVFFFENSAMEAFPMEFFFWTDMIFFHSVRDFFLSLDDWI